MTFIGDDTLLVYDGGLVSGFLFETAVKALHTPFENDYLDCMALAKKVLKKQLPHYKLKNIATHYSLLMDDDKDIFVRCSLINDCYLKLIDTVKD